MAYTTVPTKNTGDEVTAADWNTYIKDNFAAGVPDIFTTKGDIAVATAADAASRLGVGADGTILTAASGEATGLAWQSFPAAKYKVSAHRLINNDTITVVNYDTQVFDTDSAVTTGANWVFTVPAGATGYYLVTACIDFEADAGWEVNESAYLAVYIDAAEYCVIGTIYAHGAGTFRVFVNGATVVYAAATSTIDIRAYQDSDSNINIFEDGSYSHVSIVRIK